MSRSVETTSDDNKEMRNTIKNVFSGDRLGIDKDGDKGEVLEQIVLHRGREGVRVLQGEQGENDRGVEGGEFVGIKREGYR